jgi:hypothetical protein
VNHTFCFLTLFPKEFHIQNSGESLAFLDLGGRRHGSWHRGNTPALFHRIAAGTCPDQGHSAGRHQDHPAAHAREALLSIFHEHVGRQGAHPAGAEASCPYAT